MGIRVGGGILLGYLGIFFALKSYQLLKTQPNWKQTTAPVLRSVLLQTARKIFQFSSGWPSPIRNRAEHLTQSENIAEHLNWIQTTPLPRMP